MSKSYINKIKIYLNQAPNEKFKKYIVDSNGAIYFTDKYSIIKLFDTQYNRKQRLEIFQNFDKMDPVITEQVIEFIKNFEEKNFIYQVQPTEIDKDYYKFADNNIVFNRKKIARISKIISNDNIISYFTSEKEPTAICLVGENGYAYLLGCVDDVQ